MSVRGVIFLWQALEFLLVFYVMNTVGMSSALIVIQVLLVMVLLRAVVIGLVCLFVASRYDVMRLTINQFIRYWFDEFFTFTCLYFFYQILPKSLLLKNDRVTTNHVIFAHGFMCNNGFWQVLAQKVKSAGLSVSYVEMTAAFASIELFSSLIEAEVLRVSEENTQVNIRLITFSMGGLAGRYYISSKRPKNVKHIAIYTPFRGTFFAEIIAKFGAKNGQQMSRNSQWLTKLHKQDSAPILNFIGYWTVHDTIVIPAKYSEPAGPSVTLIGRGHLSAALDRDLHNQVCQQLDC